MRINCSFEYADSQELFNFVIFGEGEGESREGVQAKGGNETKGLGKEGGGLFREKADYFLSISTTEFSLIGNNIIVG